MTNISSVVGKSSMRKINDQVIFVQVLVVLLLGVNFMLIITFFMKDVFYRNMRYILFANILLSDCINLIITDLLLILSYFRLNVQMWLCSIIFTVASLYNFVTPVTLTAMSLERYIAVYMPLHHAALCTVWRAVQCIFIIHGISFIPCLVTLLILFSSVTFSFFKQYKICSVEMFILYIWQGHLRSAIGQFYFLIMSTVVVFFYVRIMKVAKAASGDSKESSKKGLRTVTLHAFQLLLCFIHFCCPLIEASLLQINYNLYLRIRYFNYIMFSLVPRCLSPLIYGIRDEMFLCALKHYILCRSFSNRLVR